MEKEDLIIGYFSNKLKQEEKAFLKKLLITDSEFKKQFEFEKNLQTVLKGERAKNELRDYTKEFLASQKANSNNCTQKQDDSKYLKFAAVFLFFISIGWITYNILDTPNYENIYNTYYQPYKNHSDYDLSRSDLKKGVQNLDSLSTLKHYYSKDFNKIFERYEISLSPMNINNTFIKNQFYRAQAYLKADSIKTAKKLFHQILEYNTAYIPESNWYLALVSVKEKDNKNAIIYLEKVIKLNKYKSDTAKELIKKID